MIILVLIWPAKTAFLFERRLGRIRRRESAGGPIEALPDAWRSGIDEIRVVVEGRVLHRTLELDGLSGAALEEAARYAVEPGLPLPLSEVAITLLPPGGRKAARCVAILPRCELDAIEAWLNAMLRPFAPASASIPIVWIGPFSALLDPVDGARRGVNWIAHFHGGAPRLLQCARTSAEIDELARARGIDPDAAEQINSADLAERAARPAAARLPANWIHPRRRLTPLLRHWPAIAAGLALLLFAAAFGLKSLALEARRRTAESAINEAFARAMPGTRAVAPGEQITARLKTVRARHEILRDRLMKRGSALETLALIEEASPEGGILLNDLRISAEEIHLTGSATSIETLQKMKQTLETPRNGRPRIRLAEPETRRSPAGLGIDFSLKGAR